MFLDNFNMAMQIGCFVLLLVVAVVSADRCPRGNGWVLRGDNCYRYFLNRGSWSEALSECRRQGRGGRLPFINSQEKNNEVYEAATTSAGGQTKELKNFWVGLVEKDGRWTGPDYVGTLGSFSAWAEGEPNDGGIFAREDHVEMLAVSGLWNDEDGDEDAFVCEIPAEAECECPECPALRPCPRPFCPGCPVASCPAPEPCPECPPTEACEECPPCPVIDCPPPPPCPEVFCDCPEILCPPPKPTCQKMWTEFQGNCYLYSGKKVTLQAAKDKCKSYDASLVMVNMGEHGNDKFLGNYIEVLGNKACSWVDMNDKDKEGVFMQGGQMFEGEVNEKKGKKNKDCVMFKKDGLSHEKCAKKHEFVCVKDLVYLQPDDLIRLF